MRSNIARFAGGMIVLALALSPPGAAAQTGLSTSGVYVTDYTNLGNNANSCGHFSTPSSATSEATSAIPNCGPVVGGTASAISSSTNATRSASASGSATQSGTQGQEFANGHGYSTQYSQLTVTGTTSPADNVVFHFVTSQSETGSVNSNSGYGFWGLFASGGMNNQVFAEQTAGSAMILSGATQTAQGFDLTMPYTPTNAGFLYNFTVDAYGYITGGATGNTTETGSISAMLGGIDLVDGSGALVGSATFAQNGFATIAVNGGPVAGPPSTVPEPSSMALLGTGLVALFPTIRRRRNA